MGQDKNNDPGRRRQHDNIYLIVAIIILGPILLFSYLDSMRIKEKLGSDSNFHTLTEIEPHPISPGTINLSIGNDGFVPVEFRGPATSTPLNIQLVQERSGDIRKAPEYQGNEQWYGYMDLGNRANKRFHFVIDQYAGKAWALYFDKNNNADLTDDGAPLRNQGSGNGGPGGFSCVISIPWPVLIEGSRFAGDFNIWFFSNQSGWQQGRRASHYSRTQLQGTIRIGNHDYMALLIDQGYNDADLTNDGVAIDLDRNGKIDRGEISRASHVIDGESYTFNVAW